MTKLKFSLNNLLLIVYELTFFSEITGNVCPQLLRKIFKNEPENIATFSGVSNDRE